MGPMRHQTNGLTLSVPTKEETGEQETTNPRRLSVLDESALREDDTNLDRDQRITMITQSYQDILKSIGEDPTRQGFILSLISVHHWLLKWYFSSGLLKTPKRAAEVRRLLRLKRQTLVFLSFIKGIGFFSRKATNKIFVMWSVMRYSMKNVKIWWSLKKSICTLFANITCKRRNRFRYSLFI